MKKCLIGMLMGLAAMSAQAQATTFRLFGSLVYGWGGDQLISGTYTSGAEYELLAGTGWTWTIGGDMRLTDRIFLQASVGQQRNRVTASNGEFNFQRNPVELLGFYALNEQVRLGVGARKVYGAKLTGTGVAAGAAGTGDYDSTVGAVLEGQYFFTPPTNQHSFVSGVSLRFVRESFKLSEASGGTGEEKRGDQVGIGLFFYY